MAMAMFPFLQREIDLVVALGLSEFILRQFEIPPVQIELARSGLHLCALDFRAERARTAASRRRRGAARLGSARSDATSCSSCPECSPVRALARPTTANRVSAARRIASRREAARSVAWRGAHMSGSRSASQRSSGPWRLSKLLFIFSPLWPCYL